jgi:cysteine desulfurase
MSAAGIDLDANATTTPCDEAVRAVAAALWLGNPSSTHGRGQAARRLLGEARMQVARLVGCQPAQIVFTSGATEANHMALLGAVERAARGVTPGRRRLVLSAVEHAGLLALAERLGRQGVPVDLIPVDRQGRLDLAAAAALIGDDVALVSVMAANNETGVLMPVAEVAEIAHRHGAPLHVDATQVYGKHAWRFDGSGADLCSLSAHKLHGPKGTGALVIRKGLDWPSLLSGRQERGRRGGTENLPGIAGFGAACERAAAGLGETVARMASLRDGLEAQLAAAVPMAHIIGKDLPRVANTSCLRLGTLPAEWVLQQLDAAGVYASSGAACHAGGNDPSHVLGAMGLARDEALAAIRLSLHRESEPRDLTRTVQLLAQVVHKARDELAMA